MSSGFTTIRRPKRGDQGDVSGLWAISEHGSAVSLFVTHISAASSVADQRLRDRHELKKMKSRE